MASNASAPDEDSAADLAVLRNRVMPITLAHERSQQVRAVSEPLNRVVPDVRPGWSLGFSGAGGWTLAMMVLADLVGESSSGTDSKTVAGRWSACIGLEELGLVAAHEFGVPMNRLLMVETPPVERWAVVVAALVEAVDVICLNPARPVRAREARRLQARAREQETVLLHLDGGRSWPTAMDVSFVARQQWSGLGQGHGYLRDRRLLIESSGRRAPGAGRYLELVINEHGSFSPYESTRHQSGQQQNVQKGAG